MNTQLPPKLDRVLRSSLSPTTALSETARWLESRSTDALVIEGDTGSGKSVAAAWAWRFVTYRVTHKGGPMEYHEMHSTPPWPVWCDAPTIATLQPWSQEWAAFDRARLVVVDDVGTEEKADRMTSVLERLWNVSGGRAILTTNLSVADFGERYGARVASRLAGTGTWVRCGDPDMRIVAPTGTAFPRPDDETSAELVARLKAEEEKRIADAEWERGREERDRNIAKMLDDFGFLSDAKRLQVVPTDASDEERRELLRKQVEARKAVD